MRLDVRIWGSLAAWMGMLVGLAGAGDLSGLVQDRITLQPLAGAVVTWVERNASVTTDGNGRFVFSSTQILVPKRVAHSINALPHRLEKGKVVAYRISDNGQIKTHDLAGKESPYSRHAFPVAGIWDARQRLFGGEDPSKHGSGGVAARRAAVNDTQTLMAQKAGYHTDTLIQVENAVDSLTLALLDTSANTTCGTHTWACWPMPNPVSSSLPRPAIYTDLGNGVILDRVTRLRWQKTPGPVTLNWDMAHDYCDTLKLAGAKWRLPTRIETMSLVDFTRTSPAIDKSVFTSPSQFFHTASPWILTVQDSTRPKYAWVFNFYEGLTSNAGGMANTYHVRCLQDPGSGALPARQPKNPYAQILPGEMRDNYTGLIWQRGDSPAQMNRDAALAYCADLGLNGGRWRLPSIKEISTLVDETKVYGAIDTAAFPGTAPNQWYWSSSAWAGAADKSAGGGWGINFDDGFTGYSLTTGWVRCVR